MDKEHLKEGSDSRQSGCLEIRYVAACCMFLLKRNHACDTCGYGKEWLLIIECKFYYNEFEESLMELYSLKSFVCASMCSDE